jgi:tetratricopeptide (TPR) repeat protein
VLLILDYYPLGRLDIEKGWTGAKRVVLEKLPFFFLCIVVSLVTILTHREGLEAAGTGMSIPADRILVAIRGYFFYLYKIFLPLELTPYYPFPTDVTLFSVEYAGSVLLFIAITVYAVLTLKRRAWVAAAWAYYVVTLLPVIFTIKLGSAIAAAERYTYLPSLAPSLLVALLAARAFERGRWKYSRLVAVVSVLVVSIVFSAMTVKQTGVWKDTLALWSHAATRTPDQLKVRYNLGNAYYRLGRTEEALEEYRAAVSIAPGFFMANYQLGNVYYKLGRTEEAVVEYRAVVKRVPWFLSARLSLAASYEKLERTDEAIEEYKKALRYLPDNVETLNSLANAYFREGRFNEARREYEKALRVNPDLVKARYELAATYHRLGLTGKAVSAYREVLKRSPGFADAHFNLALVYKSQGRMDEAKREIEETLRINPDHRGAAKAW